MIIIFKEIIGKESCPGSDGTQSEPGIERSTAALQVVDHCIYL